ncbi:MAG: OmpA family protein, partial [Gammaproteobacteria bacterium]|nr:OmpA family protein [Gammaproteobacteria bacterium]
MPRKPSGSRRNAMILSVALLSSAGGAQAHTYGAGIENSQWYVSASIFACSLTHSIPQFGQAVFHHEAGEKLRFHLNAQAPLFASGNAALVIEAPPWRPGQPVNDLGPVPVSRDAGRVVDLDHRLATQMIQGMLSGMMPTFTRKAWYGDETIRVRISGINFASFYQDYQNCVAGLLPVNFAQVERTSVLFGAGERELDDEDKALL